MNDHQDGPIPADPRHARLVALLYGELLSEEADALRFEIDRDPGLRRDWEEIRSAREALALLPAVEPIRGTWWDEIDAARSRRPAAGPGWRPIADPRGSSHPRIGDRLRRLFIGSAWGVAAAALLLLALGLARFHVERLDRGFAFTVGPQSVESGDGHRIVRGGSRPAPVGGNDAVGGNAGLVGLAGLAGTAKGGDLATLRSASYVTREELRNFGTELGRSLAVILDQRAGQRDAEMAAWMQTAFQEVSRRQSVGYGDLRGRIEEVGIGLARGQYDANERINLLLREDRWEPNSPALVPAIEEGEIPR
jgi:hypothetical protein